MIQGRREVAFSVASPAMVPTELSTNASAVLPRSLGQALREKEHLFLTH